MVLAFKIVGEKDPLVEQAVLSPLQQWTINFKSRLGLLLGLLFSNSWFIEPGLLSRWFTQYTLTKYQDISLLCVVPPYWWTSEQGALHGWASILDIIYWVGLLGIIFLFIFMKTEFDRSTRVCYLRFLESQSLLIYSLKKDLGVVDCETSSVDI
jgi:hypothetical protein